ncbi:SAF domain-containing protein (plasmid) [Alicyclobacillus fastidiosus]|uniref:SAF domain-containing protein n=1 Tax=Alicyclobacillus fastidiosus TaxID=392011 RepID=A0ABY6ZPV7_9BACL|nr:SAF domain-containing protein [Alicyclobacillus fastidiosus]WAH44890.1 SAF domain-containing protein [Alicyclobacillus fastidiosus]GMA65649.1 hypothetical protein GCM10025859_60890 [Alicyclobacillus fastidiosus]
MKTWVKYTVAAAVFAIGGPGSIAYNQFLSPYLNDETVYVASQNLGANSPINTSDFIALQLKRTEVSPNAITDPTQLEGMYTTQTMSKNQQFTSIDIEQNPLALTPGTQDVPITSSWIAAMSPTIRQGDYVKIVPLPPTQTSIAVSPNVNGKNPNGNNQPINSLQDLENANSSLDNIPVLYVHTSDNQEVTDASSSTTPTSRDNANGMPNNLDLKMTNAQAETLAGYIQQGYKLFIWGTTHKNIPGIRG